MPLLYQIFPLHEELIFILLGNIFTCTVSFKKFLNAFSVKKTVLEKMQIDETLIKLFLGFTGSKSGWINKGKTLKGKESSWPSESLQLQIILRHHLPILNPSRGKIKLWMGQKTIPLLDPIYHSCKFNISISLLHKFSDIVCVCSIQITA